MNAKLNFPITMSDGVKVKDRDELKRYIKYKKYDLNKDEEEYKQVVEKYYNNYLCGYGLELI